MTNAMVTKNQNRKRFSYTRQTPSKREIHSHEVDKCVHDLETNAMDCTETSDDTEDTDRFDEMKEYSTASMSSTSPLFASSKLSSCGQNKKKYQRHYHLHHQHHVESATDEIESLLELFTSLKNENEKKTVKSLSNEKMKNSFGRASSSKEFHNPRKNITWLSRRMLNVKGIFRN